MDFLPHQQYVSGLAWAPWAAARPFSPASYDGTIKCLDLERREFRYLYQAEHRDLGVRPRRGRLWLATNEGELGAVDPRTGAQADVSHVGAQEEDQHALL